jgi:hypothetical protein
MQAASNGDADEDNTADHGAIHEGWSAGQQIMDSTSQWASAFKPEEKSQVIKFLQDNPYASFRRHWIERNSPEGRTVRAWTCLKTVSKDCPLCEIGDKAQAVSAFNIAIIGDAGQVERKSWDVGARLFNVLKSYANDPKIAPLTKGYFLVSKTGKRGTVQYNVTPIKATSLEEDYDVEVPTDDAFKRLELYTKDIIDLPLPSKLRELATEMVDDYD